ncbi:NAD(P)H-binding protein [Cryomorphaceae bacterium]|nr:NAD(P)H-binding protein [Cryomorphaceae bacterium]
MHTILGAGGAVGQELAKSLIDYSENIRLVQRNPVKINDTDEVFAANLTHPDEVNAAVRGSEVVYVTIGFPYKTAVWKQLWVPFIEHVIASCRRHKAKLVFFDNVYMYDRDHLDGMTEETPIRPTSEKGKIREHVARLVQEAHEKGEVDTLIARAADFMCTTPNSVPYSTIVENLKKGKPAQWLAAKNKVHNFTFTPDAGAAVALLGNTDDAFGEVWHMPSNPERLTAEDWTAKIAEAFGAKNKLQVLPTFMMTPLGWFMPVMKEIKEMIYQYDRDYHFDSSKFEKRFGMAPTPIEDQIAYMVEHA